MNRYYLLSFSIIFTYCILVNNLHLYNLVNVNLMINMRHGFSLFFVEEFLLFFYVGVHRNKMNLLLCLNGDLRELYDRRFILLLDGLLIDLRWSLLLVRIALFSILIYLLLEIELHRLLTISLWLYLHLLKWHKMDL